MVMTNKTLYMIWRINTASEYALLEYISVLYNLDRKDVINIDFNHLDDICYYLNSLADDETIHVIREVERIYD